jgi:hypothetical protein
VRDGKGGVASDDMKVQVVNTGSAFRLTTRLGGVDAGGKPGGQLGCGRHHAGADQLQQGGSVHHPERGGQLDNLAVSQPNSGAATVTLPADLASAARLKVACSDNIFFAISPAKLPVVQSGGSSGGGGGGGAPSVSGLWRWPCWVGSGGADEGWLAGADVPARRVRPMLMPWSRRSAPVWPSRITG